MSEVNIPQDIRNISRERAARFYTLLSTPVPDQIGMGQIWSTHASFQLEPELLFKSNEPRLVVVLRALSKVGVVEQIAVAPISLETSMAAEYDLLITGGASPVGFDFIIEVWNETSVIVGQLKQYHGELVGESLSALRELYKVQLLDIELPSTLKELVGLPIMGEADPRLTFQESEIAAVTYLSQASIAAMEIGEPVEEIMHTVVRTQQPQRVFSLQPLFTKLSDLFKGPAVAFAAGVVEEDKTYVVHHQQDDEEMLLELLNSRRSPYDVYLKVLSISHEFERRECIITITTHTAVLRSLPSELVLGAQIMVGSDPDFRRDQVKLVTVEVS